LYKKDITYVISFFCVCNRKCKHFLLHKPSGGCTSRTEEGSCAAVRRRAKSSSLISELRDSERKSASLFSELRDSERKSASLFSELRDSERMSARGLCIDQDGPLKGKREVLFSDSKLCTNP